MRRSFKFRLEPTKKQKTLLFVCLRLCQDLYNAAIEERRNAYDKWITLEKPKKWKGWPTKNSQQSQLPQIKKLDECIEYKNNVHSKVLQQVLERVEIAYEKFYKNLKKGNGKQPKFKGKSKYKSFTYVQNGYKLNNNRLYLSKIGHIKIRLSRKVLGTIKTVTIKWEHGHWFAIFSCDNVPQEILPETNLNLGIDFGLEHIANFHNGETINQPRFFKDSQVKLRLAQRKLSKKKKRGKNRHKQRIKVAKIHSKIERKRTDFQFKETRKIVYKFKRIAYEEHSLQFMVKNRRLAKSTLDRAIDSFKQKLASQVHKTGRKLIEVKTRDEQGVGNSQRCLCGAVQKKKLSQRIHSCPDCCVKVPRDQMAASIVYFRAFGTFPKWYQDMAGQVIKSPARAMVAALHCESTVPSSSDEGETHLKTWKLFNDFLGR
jgi:putative transposase